MKDSLKIAMAVIGMICIAIGLTHGLLWFLGG